MTKLAVSLTADGRQFSVLNSRQPAGLVLPPRAYRLIENTSPADCDSVTGTCLQRLPLPELLAVLVKLNETAFRRTLLSSILLSQFSNAAKDSRTIKPLHYCIATFGAFLWCFPVSQATKINQHLSA